MTERKSKSKLFMPVLIAAILVFALVAAFGKLLADDTKSYSGSGVISDEDENLTANQIIENYANENGLSIDDYSQSLVDLLGRNKEQRILCCHIRLKRTKSLKSI